MSLISCPACGKQVSKQAPSCPQCGHPLAPPPSAAPQKIIVQQPKSGSSGLVGCLLLLLLLGGGAFVLFQTDIGKQLFNQGQQLTDAQRIVGKWKQQDGPLTLEFLWWTPLSRPKNCIPSVQYRVWIQFHIPTPSGPPCPRRSCSHRRPFTGAEGLRCEQERLSRIANAASAPVHFPGRPPLQRLVRSFLVVEREVPTQTPLQLGHDLVAVQVHVLVLHRPP